MPPRIAALPMSERGYPVPFFVAYVDGKPEFRAADGRKKMLCIRDKLCWVCGQRLGKFLVFPLGPMCAINRNTAEPPCHDDCARWSVEACPFMLNPNMVRRENNMPEEARDPGGIMVDRNPGVFALYSTLDYKPYLDGPGDLLIRVGEPLAVSWYSQGRKATRTEVLSAIKSGVQLLEKHCNDLNERKELAGMVADTLRFLPT